MLKRLELPYRTMLLCTGDMGFASREDLRHRGVAAEPERRIARSRPAATPRRSRRAARTSRFRPDGTGKPEFAHTLNGSGLAVGRTLIAMLENYQQAGRFVVSACPDALRRLEVHRRWAAPIVRESRSVEICTARRGGRVV